MSDRKLLIDTAVKYFGNLPNFRYMCAKSKYWVKKGVKQYRLSIYFGNFRNLIIIDYIEGIGVYFVIKSFCDKKYQKLANRLEKKYKNLFKVDNE